MVHLCSASARFFVLHQEGDLIMPILLYYCVYAAMPMPPPPPPLPHTSWCRVELTSYHHLCGTRAKARPMKERRPRRFVELQSNADSRLIRRPTPSVWCTKYYLRARVFRTWFNWSNCRHYFTIDIVATAAVFLLSLMSIIILFIHYNNNNIIIK